MKESTSRYKGRELPLEELAAIEDGAGLEFIDCIIPSGRLQAEGLWAATFRNCQFQATEFVSCDFQECSFEGCSFLEGTNGAEFRFCDLKSAQFKRCDLTLGQMNGCEAFDISFEECRLRGFKVENTGFSHALGPVIRREALFSNCQMEDAILTEIELANACFRNCSLRNANLAETDLSRAELLGCDLYGVDLRDADLSDATLTGSQLDGFDLTVLKSYQRLTISASQQHHLLASIGLNIDPD